MGASRYRTKFNNTWTAEYPIKSVPNDIYKFYYIPYHKALSCDYQGKKDVTDHCARSPTHKECVKSSMNQATLDMFCACNTAQTSLELNVVNAEVKISNFLVQPNLPLATLPRIILHTEQKRLPSSMKLLLHIVVNILFNIVKPILSHPFLKDWWLKR